MNKHEHQARRNQKYFSGKEVLVQILDILVKILVKVSLEYQHPLLPIKLSYLFSNKQKYCKQSFHIIQLTFCGGLRTG